MTFNGQDVADLYLKVLNLGGKSGYMKYRTVPVFPQVGDKINKAIERIATKQEGARDAVKQAQVGANEALKKAGVKVDAWRGTLRGDGPALSLGGSGGRAGRAR